MKKGTTSLLLVLFVIACLAVSCKDEQPTPPMSIHTKRIGKN